jgi:hypothetical protein
MFPPSRLLITHARLPPQRRTAPHSSAYSSAVCREDVILLLLLSDTHAGFAASLSHSCILTPGADMLEEEADTAHLAELWGAGAWGPGSGSGLCSLSTGRDTALSPSPTPSPSPVTPDLGWTTDPDCAARRGRAERPPSQPATGPQCSSCARMLA